MGMEEGGLHLAAPRSVCIFPATPVPSSAHCTVRFREAGQPSPGPHSPHHLLATHWPLPCGPRLNLSLRFSQGQRSCDNRKLGNSIQLQV